RVVSVFIVRLSFTSPSSPGASGWQALRSARWNRRASGAAAAVTPWGRLEICPTLGSGSDGISSQSASRIIFSTRLPVFQRQSGNPAELGGVVRDHDQAVSQSDGRDHEVIRTDEHPLGREVGSKSAVGFRARIIERNGREQVT